MSKTQKITKTYKKRLLSVSAKRAKTVIRHILKHGHITTEELNKVYGYEHAPRAARDVREEGIPLVTFKVKDSKNRSIAAYRFGDLSKISRGKLGGRKAFSKSFKKSLVKSTESRCHVCTERYQERYLQIDHRIPYEVVGDVNFADKPMTNYMLLCGSCNRAKSWSCEHCKNWKTDKKIEVCQGCYWAFPNNYSHIAGRDIRRLDVVWSGNEVSVYEKIKSEAEKTEVEMPIFIKKILSKRFKK